jgi:hypothetical protein
LHEEPTGEERQQTPDEKRLANKVRMYWRLERAYRAASNEEEAMKAKQALDEFFAQSEPDEIEAIHMSSHREVQGEVIQDVQSKAHKRITRGVGWVPRGAEYLSTGVFGTIGGTIVGMRRAWKYFLAGWKSAA